MAYGQAGRALGERPNALRYAATTGTVLMPVGGRPAADRLDGAETRRRPAGRSARIGPPVPAHLRPRHPGGVLGLGGDTRGRAAIAAFEGLAGTLIPVSTPIGSAWAFASDEPELLVRPRTVAPARLLPSGDAYFLLQGPIGSSGPRRDRRRELWTPRVRPGAVLVEGEIVGTWRRAQERMTIQDLAASLAPGARRGRGGSGLSCRSPGPRGRSPSAGATDSVLSRRGEGSSLGPSPLGTGERVTPSAPQVDCGSPAIRVPRSTRRSGRRRGRRPAAMTQPRRCAQSSPKSSRRITSPSMSTVHRSRQFSTMRNDESRASTSASALSRWSRSSSPGSCRRHS